MATLLERLATARDRRHQAEEEFRAVLREAKEFHSWAQLGQIVGMSPSGVRFWIDENERRRLLKKGENHGAE